jgi:hypothetical protein
MNLHKVNYILASVIVVIVGILALFEYYMQGKTIATPQLMILALVFWNTQHLFQIKEELS